MNDPFENQDPPRHPDKSPEHMLSDFEFACKSAEALFEKRNKEYDGAFRRYGLLGVIFEILGILNRLPAMTIWKSPDEILNAAKLYDLFLDLHNYSCMALMLLEENNWNGKSDIYENQETLYSSHQK